jgi:hypothetical protein
MAGTSEGKDTMKVEIKSRWSGCVLFEAGVECSADDSDGFKLGLAVKLAYKTDADLRDAYLRGADLRGADLRGADLSDADLTDADLRGADLRGADLRGADLRGADLSDADLRGADLRGACPVKIENIHQRVFEAASKDGALNMGDWHNGNFCGTTHCRAGWVTHLAGEGGRALDWAMGTPAAAALIYMASDPTLERIPDFYCSNEQALEDMKRLAELEAEKHAETAIP